MPKKTQQKAANQPYPFHGFVDVRLTEVQLAGQKKWEVSPEELLEGMLTLVEADYAVKFKWDSNNNCHQASLTGNGIDHEYCGWHLVARGSSPLKALKQLLYIHFKLWEGVWPLQAPKQAREDYE